MPATTMATKGMIAPESSRHPVSDAVQSVSSFHQSMREPYPGCARTAGRLSGDPCIRPRWATPGDAGGCWEK
ncbi:hypothetical protein GCM10009769_29460 [Curtobacterium luteum]|uniref:Uncharacterized protein n=1 Tax=Curtobacterium luteum TaxID=33881 RepID=A0A8H9KZX7_9MICO|nr:hypothetical protein GCM10009769_29460 [Curtobacterium luteum]